MDANGDRVFINRIHLREPASSPEAFGLIWTRLISFHLDSSHLVLIFGASLTYAVRVKSLRKIPLQFVADLTATQEEEIGKKEERKKDKKKKIRGRQQVKEKEKS